MTIVHIAPGTGGAFYCQNCLRDSSIVTALRAMGHDVLVVPMYLPLLTDEPGLARDVPVFYGAVGVYLKQMCPFLSTLPGWIERLLDSPVLLKWASGKAGSTRARGLEEMTLSVLRGEEGRQAAELDKLITWLRGREKPDVVHVSNALLLGIADRIRTQLDVPVVCSVQDEDTWVDTMDEVPASQVWNLVAAKAGRADALIAVSRYYADVLMGKVDICADRVHVVHIGINPNGYEPAREPPDPPTIGFLSRTSESLGLGILVEAFIELKSGGDSLRNLRLRIMGGQPSNDRRFLRRIRRRLDSTGMAADVDFLPRFDRTKRQSFLRSLTVLSVPVPGGDAFGTYIIEAMACAVPVVQPRVGAYPEIVEATGGGVLYDPADPPALAAALSSLLRDPDRARDLGRRGRKAVLEKFTVERMAASTLSIYNQCISQYTP